MNRSRFLVAVLVLGGLLGASEVRSASNEHQLRLEEFRAKALKDRQAQGLDKNRAALYAKYPSPEAKLVAKGELPTVLVGSEATVTATGRFLPGSMANMVCAGAEVLSEKVTGSRLEARVRVTTGTPPGLCSIRVMSPVSLAHTSVPAFRVPGNYQWELALANGLKVRMSSSEQDGSPFITGTSEWFGKDGKSLGTRPVDLKRTSEGYLVTLQRTSEESSGSDAAREAGNKEANNDVTQKQVQEIQQKMQQECLKLASDKMGPCMQKYTAQLRTISQQMQGRVQAAQQQASATIVGCESLSLQVRDGKVTGQASTCGAPGDVALTGTLTAKK